MPTWLVLLTGCALGVRHAFDRDHVTAVTHFISLEPNPRKSAWFGARWALGHAASVFLLGGVVLLLRLHITERVQRYLELTVGISLIILAVWRLMLLAREQQHMHPHRHEGAAVHAHPHVHAPSASHVHPWAPTFIGMLHGAAGTMEIFVLIPISLMVSAWLAYSYMAVFSAGCMISMSTYGYAAGHLYTRAGATGVRLYRWVVILTSLAGLTLGTVWIVRNL